MIVASRKMARHHPGFAVCLFVSLTLIVLDVLGFRCAAAQRAQSPVTLKVCVMDEGGRPIAIQPRLLNAPPLIGKKDGDCYSSGPIKLDPSQIYFIAAVKPDNTAFAVEPLFLNLAKKDQVVTLTLHGTKAPTETAINVCVKSKDGESVPLSSSEPASQMNIKQLQGQPGCVQAIAALSPQYNLNLMAETGQPQNEALASVTLMKSGGLAILTLALVSVVLGSISLFQFRALRKETLTIDSLKTVTQKVSDVFVKAEELHKLIVTVPRQIKDLLPVLEEPPPAKEPAVAPEARTKPAQPPTGLAVSADDSYNRLQDAKRKYSELRRGTYAEHFFLMPSGASSATDMVNDARLELREQSHGTYIAFRSTADATEAWVFPKPGVYFTPDMFNAVFPELTAADYQRGTVEPRLAVEEAPLVWKIK